jgi:hypothetical protein
MTSADIGDAAQSLGRMFALSIIQILFQAFGAPLMARAGVGWRAYRGG